MFPLPWKLLYSVLLILRKRSYAFLTYLQDVYNSILCASSEYPLIYCEVFFSFRENYLSCYFLLLASWCYVIFCPWDCFLFWLKLVSTLHCFIESRVSDNILEQCWGNDLVSVLITKVLLVNILLFPEKAEFPWPSHNTHVYTVCLPPLACVDKEEK